MLPVGLPRRKKPIARTRLPGDHRFRVEFKQRTQSTTVPLVDLIMIINDAVTAAEHDETDTAFPVKPGVVYRIHY